MLENINQKVFMLKNHRDKNDICIYIKDANGNTELLFPFLSKNQRKLEKEKHIKQRIVVGGKTYHNKESIDTLLQIVSLSKNELFKNELEVLLFKYSNAINAKEVKSILFSYANKIKTKE